MYVLTVIVHSYVNLIIEKKQIFNYCIAILYLYIDK